MTTASGNVSVVNCKCNILSQFGYKRVMICYNLASISTDISGSSMEIYPLVSHSHFRHSDVGHLFIYLIYHVGNIIYLSYFCLRNYHSNYLHNLNMHTNMWKLLALGTK